MPFAGRKLLDPERESSLGIAQSTRQRFFGELQSSRVSIRPSETMFEHIVFNATEILITRSKARNFEGRRQLQDPIWRNRI